MERAGFEVRDVESLREHYVGTLHTGVANLEAGWDDAVGLDGLARARIWRLYMAGRANRFEQGAMSIHQVLGVVTDDAGRSFMPPTRSDWESVEQAAGRGLTAVAPASSKRDHSRVVAYAG